MTKISVGRSVDDAGEHSAKTLASIELYHPETGKIFDSFIVRKKSITIGREQTCDIRISDIKVSRCQCRIEIDDAGEVSKYRW